MNLSLTERARKRIQRAIRRATPGHVPALVRATMTDGPAWYFWGLFRSDKTTTREGWFLFFYRPEQRPKVWISEIAGITLSVSPDMRNRLEGKTLDYVHGQLEEI